MKNAPILPLSLILATMVPSGAQQQTPPASGAQVEILDRPPAGPGNSHYPANREPLLPNRLIKLPPGSIRPHGWLLRQLQLQRDGLTGHLPKISAWLQKSGNAWLNEEGKGQWGWEEVPYWLKGYIELACILDDQAMIAEAATWVEGALRTQRADGDFGPLLRSPSGIPDLWPNMIMLHSLRSHHERTGDPRVINLMTRYFRYLSGLPEKAMLAGEWDKVRGGDNLASVYWLYNRTGDAFLLDLARMIHRRTSDWRQPGRLPTTHNVNIAQGFGEPTVFYQQSRDPGDLQAAYDNFRLVRRQFGQMPGGMFAGDENTRPGQDDPRQGIETCGIVEQMFADEQLLAITGDPFWADHCENVAFNTLPAALMPDGKALRYVTCPNQVLSDDQEHDPGLDTRWPLLIMSPVAHRCCQHNHSHGWPYFAGHLWCATQDNGLAAALYAAATVRARVADGTEVTITTATRYPFEEDIRFTIDSVRAVSFPLYLRVPGWCLQPLVEINDQPVPSEAKPLQYLRIMREWHPGDTVKLRLPMQVRVTSWEQNHHSASVERGPLAFSLKIGERMVRRSSTEVLTPNSQWQQDLDTARWPAWEIHPTSPWNFGLVLDPLDPAASFRLVEHDWPADDMPFTHSGTPVSLQATGRKIPEWRLDRHRLVGKLRDSPVRSSEPLEPLTLVPMGAARLRISSFPAIGEGPAARPWLPDDVPGFTGQPPGESRTDALQDWRAATREDRCAWWKHDRFGMFIHWGVYAVPAGVYQGREVQGTGEWIMNRGRIPIAEYKQFARQFNPVNYDPDAWVRLAKAAGMRYIVITAKHHDGFALFDSKATDWDVVDATPYGKDLLTPLAAACRRHGLKFGLYYSQAQDWCHPGGAGSGWDPAQRGDMDRYLREIAVPQVREILANYGRLDILWWDTPYDMDHQRIETLWPLMRLQPHILTNDRLGHAFGGDFVTPEQGIPNKPQDHNWETCMTMNSTWGYQSNNHAWKSAAELLANLIECASKGGNYLLNIGPTADGSIPTASIDRLREISRWMDLNSEAIHGTAASPFGELPFGRVTSRASEHTLYLHIFDWPANSWLELPGMHSPVRSATLLAAPTRVLETDTQTRGVVRIRLPAPPLSSFPQVLKLRYEGALKADRFVPKTRPAAEEAELIE